MTPTVWVMIAVLGVGHEYDNSSSSSSSSNSSDSDSYSESDVGNCTNPDTCSSSDDCCDGFRCGSQDILDEPFVCWEKMHDGSSKRGIIILVITLMSLACSLYLSFLVYTGLIMPDPLKVLAEKKNVSETTRLVQEKPAYSTARTLFTQSVEHGDVLTQPITLKKSQVLIVTEGEVPGGDVGYVSREPISASMPVEGAAGRKGAVGAGVIAAAGSFPPGDGVEHSGALPASLHLSFHLQNDEG